MQDFVEDTKVQYAESQVAEDIGRLQRPVGIKHRGYSLALLFTFVLLLLPIWTVRYPGMVDYHNHLARTFILAHYRDVPVFEERYVVNHDPKPNLAMDAVVAPLAKVLNVEIAGKLFLSLMALVWCAGCHFLGKVSIGGTNWFALPASLLFYNSNLVYGFVNYVASVALFACAFAMWLRWRGHTNPRRILTCAALAMIVFLAHLAGYAALVVAAAVVSLAESRGRRFLSVAREIWYLGLPVPLTLIFAHRMDRAVEHLDSPIIWNNPKGKAIALFPFFTYNHALDGIFLIVLAGCGYLLARRLRAIRLSLWASGALFLFFLVLPMGLLTVSAVDARCVLPAWLLAILAVEVKWDRRASAAFLICMLILVLRELDIERNSLRLSRAADRVVKLGAFIAPNATVYPLIGDVDKQDLAVMHADEYWTMSRHVYLPTLFALPGQAPLSFRRIPCYWTPRPNRAWLECLKRYDYAWTLALREPYEAELAKVADPVIRDGVIALWRVNNRGVTNDQSRQIP